MRTATTPTRVAVHRDTMERTVRRVGERNTAKFNSNILNSNYYVVYKKKLPYHVSDLLKVYLHIAGQELYYDHDI